MFTEQADYELKTKLENIMAPSDLAIEKLENYEIDTSNIWTTTKSSINYIAQSLGVAGKTFSNALSGIETSIFSDMDESEFRDTWAPAVTDIVTYLIPYVGEARIAINYLEPASVISSFVTQEEGVTLEGESRVASKTNAFGASTNIAANFASDLMFKGIRKGITKRLGEETASKIAGEFYKNSGRSIITNIAKYGGGEAIEEFAQTYAEILQNTDNETFNAEFLKNILKKLLQLHQLLLLLLVELLELKLELLFII